MSNIPKEAIQNGLLALYDMQTPVERACNRTIENNKMGFDAIDAPIMTRYAKQLCTYGSLPAPSLEEVSKRLYKYREQLFALGIFSPEMFAEQLSLGI